MRPSSDCVFTEAKRVEIFLYEFYAFLDFFDNFKFFIVKKVFIFPHIINIHSIIKVTILVPFCCLSPSPKFLRRYVNNLHLLSFILKMNDFFLYCCVKVGEKTPSHSCKVLQYEQCRQEKRILCIEK